MPNIRVVIRDAPKMLRDILEQVISSEPDMEVIAEPAGPTPVETDSEQSPDVLIVGVSDADPGERGRALLVRWPHSRVLMITARGHSVVMYELVPRCRDLGELSPSQFVQAIRSVVHPERTPRVH